jgi:hypothetical protein
MKNILPLLLFALLATASCKEKSIAIPEPSTPKRRVLVEELTGVRCTNCPDGTRTLVSLQNTFGADNLIIVAVHSAGSFSFPYNDSKYKFGFPEADALADFIVRPDGPPAASVDRRLPDIGSQSPFAKPAQWASLINSEFTKDFGLAMFLKNEYNPATRQVNIEVLMDATQTLPDENRLTVVITQDSIQDVQLDNGVKVKDYVHRHVLRGVVSSPSGDILQEPLSAGALLRRTYTFNLPDSWEARHCSVVAFVHHGGNPDKEVLQAVERHVVD